MVEGLCACQNILGVHGMPESANGIMVVDVDPGRRRMTVVLTGELQRLYFYC